MKYTEAILTTEFNEIAPARRGKVRDIYDFGDKLLIVATDRISAFDVVLPNGIPGKGKILTQISKYWFDKTSDIVQNHLLSTSVEDFPEVIHRHRKFVEGRSMLVKKAKPFPVECVVRGYLSGSGWKDYLENGSVCGIVMEPGFVESSKLRCPIFTPATKAERGQHDENITFERMAGIIGRDVADYLKEISIALYDFGNKLAEEKGIIIADTKFEFGIDEISGDVILIDEILTPDSSRFWPKDEYSPGRPQKSFDKQFVRDYLSSIGWNKKPPAPVLPPEIVEKTREKYLEALQKFTG
ncbi:MAG: phosphoribosylaminoimidazolesuccinocarboxamide synthase [Thermodesulfobacteriota bacterium]